MRDQTKISAAAVKKLREETGVSIMECKEALEQALGDMEKAKLRLKSSCREKAAKKSAREAGEGVVTSYIHSNKKIGSLVEVRCETDFVAKNSEFQELAYDLAMHIAALDPRYISTDLVPERDRKEYESIVREELDQEKKPADIVEKIVEGKIRKHFEEISLLSQPFVKNPEIIVADLIKEKISKVGENIKVEKFSRFEI